MHITVYAYSCSTFRRLDVKNIDFIVCYIMYSMMCVISYVIIVGKILLLCLTEQNSLV